MASYLFLGGPYDAHRFAIDDGHETITCKNSVALKSKTGETIVTHDLIGREVYFRASLNGVPFYCWDRMSLEDATRRLLQGYDPTDNPDA